MEAAAVIGEVDGEGSRANSELLMAAMMVTTPIVPRREEERGAEVDGGGYEHPY